MQSSSSGSTPTPPEAVNLELVDLTPPKIMAADQPDSAAAKAKKGEAMGGDYFIAVNEHKKGIR